MVVQAARAIPMAEGSLQQEVASCDWELEVCGVVGEELQERIERVLTNDPGIGVARHVDAGYPQAIAFAEKSGVKIPMPPKE